MMHDEGGEFLELVPMMDTTTAEDVFGSVVAALDRVGVDWSRAVSLATATHHPWSERKQVSRQSSERKYKPLMEEIVSGHFTVFCTRRHCVASP